MKTEKENQIRMLGNSLYALRTQEEVVSKITLKTSSGTLRKEQPIDKRIPKYEDRIGQLRNR